MVKAARCDLLVGWYVVLCRLVKTLPLCLGKLGLTCLQIWWKLDQNRWKWILKGHQLMIKQLLICFPPDWLAKSRPTSSQQQRDANYPTTNHTCPARGRSQPHQWAMRPTTHQQASSSYSTVLVPSLDRQGMHTTPELAAKNVMCELGKKNMSCKQLHATWVVPLPNHTH